MKAQLGALCLAGLACAVAGCHVTSEPREAAHDVAAAWSEADGLAVGAEPEREWWRAFQDPVLDGLVVRALEQNLDLALARARIVEARALRDVVAGGDDPQVDAVAGVSRSRRSANEGSFLGDREQDSWAVGFDARWELDLFGRNAAAVAAAEAGIEIAEEGRRDAQVVLLGELARVYVELRGLQRELAVARQNLASQRDTLGLTDARFRAGMASELDMVRARAQVAAIAATVPSLEAGVRVAIHRLSVLVAREPNHLSQELAPEGRLPEAPDVVAAGLPADLLRRRPDVRRAERELAQECALEAAARAELYPRISLAGSWGQRSVEGAELFDAASNGWSLGAGLVWPIFSAGVLQANVRVQSARAEQALVRWQISVLAAQAEVEDALASLARERERAQALEESLRDQVRAVELANDLFTRGMVDFFEVLQAQRDQFRIETDLARSATQTTTQAVALYKALGGGWE